MEKYSQRILINAIFMLALMLLAICGFFSYRLSKELVVAKSWVYHSNRVIETSNQTLLASIDAESQLYSYLISPSQQTLLNITNRLNTVDNNFILLRHLTLDNQNQQKRLAVLGDLLKQQTQLFKQILREYSVNPSNSFEITANQNEQIVAEQIKQQFVIINQEENSLLILRDAVLTKERAETDLITIWSGLFSGILFIISIILLNYHLTQRNRAENKRNQMDDQLLLVNQRLQDNTERYELALAGSNSGLADWNIDTGDVFYSSNLKHLLGYDDSEFTPLLSSWENCLHPEDKGRVLAEVKQHLEEHTPFNIEYRLKNKAGEYRWFLNIAQAKWDEQGKPTRMVGSLIDITESKKQEAGRSLSTPVLQLDKKLLILSVIGEIDTQRAYQITNQMLNKISVIRAKVVVVDITGVPTVDSKVAHHLIQTVEAARLMGAKLIITGISATIAEILVTLSVDLAKVITTNDLQSGVKAAYRIIYNKG